MPYHSSRRITTFASCLGLGVLLACAPGSALDPLNPGAPTIPDGPSIPPPPPPKAPPQDPGPAMPPPPPGSAGYSMAALAWHPGPGDTCTEADHLRYTAKGPDGKLYPTWHPPVDPVTGCSFGHEHGRDPSTLAVSDMGPVLFGYANEQLLVYSGRMPRHEDHVGHKIEGANQVVFRPQIDGPDLTCDLLVKLHQGTHSPDAFNNNLHEIVSRVRCNDGTTFNVTFLAANGSAGEMSSGCRQKVEIQTGSPSPSDSPTSRPAGFPVRSMGNRFIPTRYCMEHDVNNPFLEVWKLQNSVVTDDNEILVRFADYFFVSNPSRYRWDAKPNALGRTVEVCYEKTTTGDWLSEESRCREARAIAAGQPVAWNDPRSPFTGTRRAVKFSDMEMGNSDSITVWYSDPFGMHARKEPFPGSIRQYVSGPNANTGKVLLGPLLKGDYWAQGVHAPN